MVSYGFFQTIPEVQNVWLVCGNSSLISTIFGVAARMVDGR